MKILKKYYLWGIVFIYILFIFRNSMDTGTQSGGLSADVAAFLMRFLPVQINFEAWHHFIRKAAHFAEYALLGILVSAAYRRQPLPCSQKLTFVFFCLIPCIDESIQHFVPGRYGSPQDVLLDLAGYASALIIFPAISRIRDKRKFQKS